MKKSLIVLATTVSVLGLVAPAHARDVKSAGSFANSCEFDATGNQNGTLAVGSGNMSLSTTASGGQPAVFGISYFGYPTITVNNPTVTTPVGQAQPTNTTIDATSTGATAGNASWTTGSGGVRAIYTKGDKDTITINFTATFSGTIRAGAYTVSSVATCQ